MLMKKLQPQCELPQELIVEVLSWLPVKSLMRFKCVCKFWSNLVLSDATFIKVHLQRSASRNPHLLLHEKPELYKLFRNWKVTPFPVSGIVENSLTTRPDHPHYPFKNDSDRIQVVGSCNGLICFYGHTFAEWLCFWNPATKLITQKLGFFRGKERIIFPPLLIFGYDNSTSDFKVLLVDLDEVRIFSLRSKSWKDVESLRASARDIRSYDSYVKQANDVVNLRGTLNWLASHPVKKYVIVSFNLGTETSTQFSLPPSDFDDENRPFVGSLIGRLCLSYASKRTHYVIWHMNKFGDDKSWTLLLKTTFGTPFNPCFPCFYNGHKLILVEGAVYEDDEDKVLLSTRDKQPVVEKIRMGNVDWSSTTGHVESLVSPYGM